jgi:hypothetical protein
VRLEKLVFTQCAMPAGPPIGCSVASVRDGPLVLSLHWQEGAIEERLVDEIIAYFERRLLSMGQGRNQ